MLDIFRAQNITWDIANRRVNQTLEASGGDANGRTLRVRITDGGEVIDLSATLSLAWRAGKNYGLDSFSSIGDGYYEIYYTTAMLAHETVKASFVLTTSGGVIESLPFHIKIADSLVDSDAIQNENSFTALTEALIEVQNIKQDEAERVSAETERATAEEEREQGYPALDGRITAVEQNIDEHLAEYASLFTDNPDAKNSIYRGKYLGNSVTSQQYTAISSGTFEDLYIGDYWIIGGMNWRIAAFNYFYNTGDTALQRNHITIVPDDNLYTHVMNDTNITTGGYTGSKMYTTGLNQAKTTIKGIFGTHLVKHRQIYSNATTDGKASGWAWTDSEVDLMSEPMVLGSVVWGESTLGGSGHNVGLGKSQLPLFTLNPRIINTGKAYWLRDVVSAAHVAGVSGGGIVVYFGASVANGVRPAFSIS